MSYTRLFSTPVIGHLTADSLAPRIGPPICTPSCLFPLGFGRQLPLAPLTVSISPIPGYSCHRMVGIVSRNLPFLSGLRDGILVGSQPGNISFCLIALGLEKVNVLSISDLVLVNVKCSQGYPVDRPLICVAAVTTHPKGSGRD